MVFAWTLSPARRRIGPSGVPNGPKWRRADVVELAVVAVVLGLVPTAMKTALVES